MILKDLPLSFHVKLLVSGTCFIYLSNVLTAGGRFKDYKN